MVKALIIIWVEGMEDSKTRAIISDFEECTNCIQASM